MELKRENCRLYAVTDRSWLHGESLKNQVEEALKGGVTMVQLREKELDNIDIEEEALEIKKLCHKYQVPFIVNDYVELAKKVDADGVHIGQSDMMIQRAKELLGENKIIGVTAKTVEQAREAEMAGASYIGSGAVFGSTTKTNTSKLDLDTFEQICESVTIPVVAIGGITKENILKLKNRKAAGVAVVSGIFAAEDIEKETKQLRQFVEQL